MVMAAPNDNLDETVGRLTQRERECLRLVAQLMTSKQIALQLGISKHTVDERIERARRRIGARGRSEAARMLASYEARLIGPPIESGPYPMGLVDSPAATPSDATFGEPRYVASVSLEPRNARRGESAEAQAEAGEGDRGTAARPPLIDHFGGDRRTLSLAARLGWIARLAIISALAFGALLSGLDALKRLH